VNEAIEGMRRTAHVASEYLSNPAPRSHACQFYEDDDFIVDALTEFTGAGLRAGDQVITVLTRPHLRVVSSALQGLGIDVARATARGQLITLDAHEVLPRFIRGELPDPDRFYEEIEDLLRAARATPHRSDASVRVRVHGEMVDLLALSGNHRAANALEELWNQALARHELTLLCTYDLGAFSRTRDAQHFDRVCSHHSHVLPAESIAACADRNERLREIARLQQRARALDSSTAFKEVFLAVGHDLRNPLSSILTTTRLMRLRGDIAGDAVQRLDRVIEGAERMQRMIDQILDATRTRLAPGIGFSFGAPVDVVPYVEAAVSDARTKHPNARIELELLEPQLARFDPERIAQVFATLLDNAAVHGDPARGIRVSVERGGSRVCVSVHNYGPPVDPETIARLLEPFEHAHRAEPRSSGLGLGLYLSQYVVRAHGGELVVESSEEAGTRFDVRLPRP
jgi:signal transduction histidine kinase